VPLTPVSAVELDGAESGSHDETETVEQAQHRRRRRGGRGRGRRSRNGNLAPAITPPSHWSPVWVYGWILHSRTTAPL